jgi:CRISPR-associated protein Cas1
MRRHLNTIYVTSEEAYCRKDGANIVVEVDKQERGRAPIHVIGGLVCFGRVSISPQLMNACTEAGVTISFLTEHGRFLARVEGPRSGNVLVRRTQHRTADDPAKILVIAKGIVAAKLANQRTVIRRALRDYGDACSLAEAEMKMTHVARRALVAADIDILRGCEGEGAALYFGTFDAMIRHEDPKFAFQGRSRRPPLDRTNALLSFLYAVLGNDCRGALEGVGLDPAIGFLHADRPGRMSLALDLMEEMRPVLADRLALSLINRRQLAVSDFEESETGAVLLGEAGRKTVLTAFSERKRQTLRHPFLGEDMPLGLVAHVQAQMLARHLRGDLDGYPGFIWK